MGKLIRLEVYNFKSYKGHHILLFGDAYFTSIIGPNGSGKSNSMDAISFVLGIKSSHLRSSHLRDLIYRGRVLRTSKINADGTATEATANGETNGETNGTVNGTQEEDNEAGSTRGTRHDPHSAWVMAVYLDDADEEQRWKRTITSAGASEYSINGRNVSAKQYNEALEQEDILIKARNFLVFQGDVEAIASQSPKDITRLVEQISGSLEYKAEYDKLKNEVELASETAQSKHQQRRAMASEMKQFRDQKAEADQYAAKAQERDDAIVNHFLFKLYHIQRVIDESNAEIEKHQEELKEHRRGVAKYEQRLQDAQREQAKATRNVTKAEQAIKVKQQAIDDKQTEMTPIAPMLDATKRRLHDLKARAGTIKEEEDKRTEAINKLKKDLTVVQKAQKVEEDKAKELAQKEGRELSEDDLQEYSDLEVEAAKQTAADRMQVDNLARNIKTTEDVMQSLQTNISSLEEKAEQLESDLQRYELQRKERTEEAKALQEQLTEKTQALNTVKSDRVRTEQRNRELNEKLQKVIRELDEVEEIGRVSQQDEQKARFVRELKRDLGSDKVFGRIVNLWRPKEKRFEQAVTVAIGRHLDSIVVDTDETAHEVIEQLKQKRMRMTIIPLDKIKIDDINPNLKTLGSKVRLAIDAVDYDPQYERAMAHVCGDTVICESFEIAKDICYRKKLHVRAVTHDGIVIGRGGVMSGGRGPKDRGDRRFAAAQVDKLRSQKDEYLEQLANLPRVRQQEEDESRISAEMAELRSKMALAKDDMETLKRNIADISKQLKHQQQTIKSERPKLAQQQKSLQEMQGSLQQYQDSIAAVDDEIFADFCSRLGYDDVRVYRAQQGVLQQERNKRRREFETQIKSLTSQIRRQTEDLDQTKARVSSIQQSIDKCQAELKKQNAAKEKIGDELDTMNVELDQLREELETAKETQHEKTSAVAERRAEYTQRSKKVDQEIKNINEREQDKRKKSSERYMLLQKCKLDEIKIPLTEDSKPIDSLPMGGNLQQQDEDAMDVDEDLDATMMPTSEERDYGIEIDYDQLEDELKESDDPQNEETLTDIIATLSAELDKMQPNMRATERLSNAEDRHTAAEKDYDGARSSLRKIQRDFDNVKQDRLERFTKAFKHISEQIVHVYAELTRSAGSSVVGNAQLTLEDDEEPYLEGLKYTAMPPLKRFRDMEHLSGGEKTIAALALLFAVHSYQPSPFFVLDEVDAALDNLNVARVANYVKKHAKPGMQFIVISLKTTFFMESESLVGIMRDQAENSSRAVTLDLRKYLPN